MSRLKTLVSFSLQRLNFFFDYCMAWPCYSFVDCLSKKCINVHIINKINHDCLPILMLLYIMLYIMLAYLMLYAALSNAIRLYNAFLLFIAIDF